jgi:hypothetical protein
MKIGWFILKRPRSLLRLWISESFLVKKASKITINGLLRTMGRAGLFFFFILTLASCASGPRKLDPYEPGQDDFALLAPGGTLYFAVDVPQARPILDLISLGNISGKNVSEALDRTGSAVAAAYGEGEPRRFLAALRGSYPRLRSGLSFAFNSAWKKARSASGDRYWRSSSYGLSIFLGADRALVSDGDPFSPPPGPVLPGGLAELRRGALLAGWLEDAGTPINQFFARLEIPIQIPAKQALFGVYALPQGAPSGKAGSLSPEKPGEGEAPVYEATLRIETPSVNQAKALVSVISMVRLFMPGGGFSGAGGTMALAAALFAKPPEQEGPFLIIHTGAMDAQEIALLFNMFSVYSE